MRTSDIVSRVNSDFSRVYKAAGPFVGSGALWDFCMDVIGDPVSMNCVIFANDLGVPPVRSLLLLYRRRSFGVRR